MIWKRVNSLKAKVRYKYNEYLFKKYTKRALVPFDENWIKGKSVAIIGGADSAYKEKLGSYIDSYDVVIRINKGVELIDKYHEYIGKRTDLLFHSLYDKGNDMSSPATLDLWKEKDVGLLVFSLNFKDSSYSLNNFSKFIMKYKGKYRITQTPINLAMFNKKLTFPHGFTTGFSTINTVFALKPAKIYITGITFLKTPHISDYRKVDNKELAKAVKANSVHNLDKEFEYFRELYLKNKDLFKLDKTLQNIIDNY